MNNLYTNFLREISLTNDWLLLLPEIILALFAFAILGIDLFLKSSKKTWQLKYIMPVSAFAYALVLAILFLFGENFYIGGVTLYLFFDTLILRPHHVKTLGSPTSRCCSMRAEAGRRVGVMVPTCKYKNNT